MRNSYKHFRDYVGVYIHNCKSPAACSVNEEKQKIVTNNIQDFGPLITTDDQLVFGTAEDFFSVYSDIYHRPTAKIRGLLEKKPISHGSSGLVYIQTIYDDIPNSIKKGVYAIKIEAGIYNLKDTTNKPSLYTLFCNSDIIRQIAISQRLIPPAIGICKAYIRKSAAIMMDMAAFSMYDICKLPEIIKRRYSSALESYAFQCLTTLKYMRLQSINHLDIKPDNFVIFLSNDNDKYCRSENRKAIDYESMEDIFSPLDELGIIDFGMSSTPNVLTTHSKLECYTDPYIPPENMYLKFDNPHFFSLNEGFAADAWAIGCVILSIYTNKLPWCNAGMKKIIQLSSNYDNLKHIYRHNFNFLGQLEEYKNTDIPAHMTRPAWMPEMRYIISSVLKSDINGRPENIHNLVYNWTPTWVIDVLEKLLVLDPGHRLLFSPEKIFTYYNLPLNLPHLYKQYVDIVNMPTLLDQRFIINCLQSISDYELIKPHLLSARKLVTELMAYYNTLQFTTKLDKVQILTAIERSTYLFVALGSYLLKNVSTTENREELYSKLNNYIWPAILIICHSLQNLGIAYTKVFIAFRRFCEIHYGYKKITNMQDYVHVISNSCVSLLEETQASLDFWSPGSYGLFLIDKEHLTKHNYRNYKFKIRLLLIAISTIFDVDHFLPFSLDPIQIGEACLAKVLIENGLDINNTTLKNVDQKHIKLLPQIPFTL